MKTRSIYQKLFIKGMFFFFFLTAHSEELQKYTYSGTVFEKGTKIPLRGTSVFLFYGDEPKPTKQETNEKGEFIFEGLKEGVYKILINLSGYFKLEMQVPLSETRTNRKIYLEKESYNVYETVVRGKQKKRDLTQKKLTQQEILAMPGADGDPIKAVQNLPGVNRASGFSSQVIIQGSAPKDTSYGLDGHRIPLVFHFGGFSSVLMPEALEDVHYLSAGYGSEYGRALGGIIDLQSKSQPPEERESKGSFFVDTLKAGIFYEKKLSDDSHFFVGGRHSYIGLILGKIMEKNEEFGLTVVPEFSDFVTKYQKRESPKLNWSILTMGSRDSLGFLLKEPLKEDPSLRGTFHNETLFYRILPQLDYKIDESSKLSASLAFGQDRIQINIGDQYFDLNSIPLTVRGEWEETWSSLNKSYFGFDNTYGTAKVRIRFPGGREEGGVRDPLASSEMREADITGKIVNLGLFVRHQIEIDRWEISPQIRYDRFSQTSQNLFAPRISFMNRLYSNLSAKLTSGVYYQPPEPQETDETYGNPKLQAPQAIHFSFGFEGDERGDQTEGWSWSASYFDRWFNQLVVPSSNFQVVEGKIIPENYRNDGKGRSYGIEGQIKFKTSPWNGFYSLTLGKSTRSDSINGIYNFAYDQTVNSNLTVGYDYGKNWNYSMRVRYVTGNPLTPIVDSHYDSDRDVYNPKRGSYYSNRYRDFMQFDFRVDKKFIHDESIWAFYLDIQNVLNQKNAESIQYSYDYQNNENVSGLPILPSIGLRGEF